MKIIDKSKLKGKEHMIDNEIAIMKACDQENLVKLVDEYETDTEIYLIMELVKVRAPKGCIGRRTRWQTDASADGGNV